MAALDDVRNELIMRRVVARPASTVLVIVSQAPLR